MRSIGYTRTGDSSVLQLDERPVPQPGPGEVRVRIAVSGVNPTDWKARASGELAVDRQVPGQDGAGTVDAAGEGVSSLQPGQRVWVWDAAWRRAEGTSQELAVLPQHQVVPLADGVSFDVGASLGIPALTAHRALTSAVDGPRRLGPGALDGVTVLVAGGAGAVGHAAIQLAVWAGATVITTVSSAEKGELARRAGAHHVVDYRASDAASAIRELAPEGVHLIVEVSPGANVELDAEVAAPQATIASYASDRDTVAVPVRASMTKNLRWTFLLTYTVTEQEKRDAVAAVREAADAGVLEVGDEAGLPLIRFPLERTAEAHDAVEAAAVGKVLIDVGV